LAETCKKVSSQVHQHRAAINTTKKFNDDCYKLPPDKMSKFSLKVTKIAVDISISSYFHNINARRSYVNENTNRAKVSQNSSTYQTRQNVPLLHWQCHI